MHKFSTQKRQDTSSNKNIVHLQYGPGARSNGSVRSGVLLRLGGRQALGLHNPHTQRSDQSLQRAEVLILTLQLPSCALLSTFRCDPCRTRQRCCEIGCKIALWHDANRDICLMGTMFCVMDSACRLCSRDEPSDSCASMHLITP